MGKILIAFFITMIATTSPLMFGRWSGPRPKPHVGSGIIVIQWVDAISSADVRSSGGGGGGDGAGAMAWHCAPTASRCQENTDGSVMMWFDPPVQPQSFGGAGGVAPLDPPQQPTGGAGGRGIAPK